MAREPLTTAEIEAIAARAAAAEVGPWSATRATDDVAYWGIGRREAMVLGPQGYSVLSDKDERRQPVAENAIFIAAARTDVPVLCAELLAARAELERLREDQDVTLGTCDELARQANRGDGALRALRGLVDEWENHEHFDHIVFAERIAVASALLSGAPLPDDALAAARAPVGEAKG